VIDMTTTNQLSAPGMQLATQTVEMTMDEMRAGATRVLNALNDCQKVDGYTIDQTLMSALMVIGSALKQRGLVLDLNAPLRQALPPLVMGYQGEINRMAS
jgi:hypothetical protein